MAEFEPSLGDLDDFDLDQKSTPSVGRSSPQENEEESQILGDISLLEEAIAELETEADEEELGSHLSSEVSPYDLGDENEIPVLDDAVDLTNTVIEFNRQQHDNLDMDGSIPVLEDIAGETGFSHGDLDDLASSLLNMDDAISSGNVSASQISEHLLEMPMDKSTIAQHEDPMSRPEASEFQVSTINNESGFAEQLSQIARTVEHSVGLSHPGTFDINLPKELHAQLSRKIDNLVVEATTSITNELHHQLTQRMDKLLTEAVESVLPSLMEQLAQGLRTEVKSKVKAQIPQMIKDVLANARLTEEVD
ncbi:MAG: hypothetical protein OEZ43_08855 [Gammaproteobacteria bacterium]|nr:hypothetical protein [Gammaproteobacteria bacterium]